MNKLINLSLWMTLVISFTGCLGQRNSENTQINALNNPVVGGPFENGDFMYVDMPVNIPSVDTSAGWTQKGQKLLVTGTIFKQDGKTPAPNVILYYYHTDINGYYSDKEGLNPKVKKHGYIRGWVKSDQNGHYSIYTVRPAAYPNRKDPAHIHPAIKEPQIDKEYYLDALVFDDDVLLTGAKRKAMENRGGSGVLRVLEKGELQIAEHNIILGLNIPNYPESKKDGINSGKSIGEDILSFTPYHAWGPDKGSTACPVCKYGRYHGILYFVGNNPNWIEIKQWLTFFENESEERGTYLKVYFVYGNEENYNEKSRIEELEKIGRELDLKKMALTFVPSFTDEKSEIYLNRLNPNMQNTILVYRQSNVIDKFINLKPTSENFNEISKRLTETKNGFFELSSPKKK